jgi:hypothetical protein
MIESHITICRSNTKSCIRAPQGWLVDNTATFAFSRASAVALDC